MTKLARSNGWASLGDIAAVAFLAGLDGGRVNGQTIRVNGGII